MRPAFGKIIPQEFGVSASQFIITAVIAMIVTAPSILLIPRARKSPAFDRVLWAATWALAFLGEWSAPSYLGNAAALNQWVIEQLPLLPVVIGAIVGALSLNLLLWLMDRFSPPISEDAASAELPAASEAAPAESPPVQSSDK